jgi:hypothetical protein
MGGDARQGLIDRVREESGLEFVEESDSDY